MLKLLLLVSILYCPALFAQTSEVKLDSSAQHSDSTYIKPNACVSANQFFSVFVEYGGNSGFASLNCDFRFLSHFSVRIGYGGYGVHDPTNNYSLGIDKDIVLGANYIFFRGEFHLETGVCTIIDLDSRYCGSMLANNCTKFKPSAFCGLRWQPFHSPFLIRLGYTPFMDFHDFRNYFGL